MTAAALTTAFSTASATIMQQVVPVVLVSLACVPSLAAAALCVPTAADHVATDVVVQSSVLALHSDKIAYET
jgi:hypothetical protein